MNLHPTYPAFPILILLSFLSTLLPLTWIRRDTIGIVFVLLWEAIACLNQFVNSLIWHGNTRNISPVWCDISSRLIVGISTAIPASVLCAIRRLYYICSMKAFLLTPAQKRKVLAEDLSICLGVPFLTMALEYIVEGHRYTIFEDIGCYPDAYNAWPSYIIFYSWPVILSLMNGVYVILTLRIITKKGKNMDEVLHVKTEKQLYYRIVILSLCQIILMVPYTLAVMVMALSAFPMYPYIGWHDIHANYSQIPEIPAVLWRSTAISEAFYEMTRWILVVCAILIYGTLGFSVDARNTYRKAFWNIAALARFQPRVLSPQPEMPLQFQERAALSDVLQTNSHDISVSVVSANHIWPYHSTMHEP
ncbi:STE3-domain-containing protein [Rickenella mellea]|uniref:STE3-domain-containing protein n=1 Tax=Rickenella mellea TaxID=50990 RepID=A0A4Y7PPS0_9AGAM|nr:STE3-domain-containing protein [Rickenella mellea]